jgi:hypothetical protein
MTLPSAGSDISQVIADALKDRDIVLRTEQSVQTIDGGRFDGLSASWLATNIRRTIIATPVRLDLLILTQRDVFFVEFIPPSSRIHHRFISIY